MKTKIQPSFVCESKQSPSCQEVAVKWGHAISHMVTLKDGTTVSVCVPCRNMIRAMESCAKSYTEKHNAPFCEGIEDPLPNTPAKIQLAAISTTPSKSTSSAEDTCLEASSSQMTQKECHTTVAAPRTDQNSSFTLLNNTQVVAVSSRLRDQLRTLNREQEREALLMMGKHLSLVCLR